MTAKVLYRHHGRLVDLAPEPWLARLEDLAASPLAEQPEPLTALLERAGDSAWLVIDAFGLPLLGAVRGRLDELLPGWTLERTTFAHVDGSTTARFYDQLAEAGVNHALEKVDVVDVLLHDRSPSFDDLCALAAAELRVALKPILKRIAAPARRSLLVIGDHGFRLAADGRGWQHGGSSTLECVVPALSLRR